MSVGGLAVMVSWYCVLFVWGVFGCWWMSGGLVVESAVYEGQGYVIRGVEVQGRQRNARAGHRARWIDGAVEESLWILYR